MQKLAHRKNNTGKLQELQENSRNLRKLKEFEKTQAFSEKKTQQNCQKTQGFANLTWFLLPKNVQKISLQKATNVRNSNLQGYHLVFPCTPAT